MAIAMTAHTHTYNHNQMEFCNKRPLSAHDELSLSLIEEPTAKKIKLNNSKRKRVTFGTYHPIHTVPRVDPADIPAVWYSGAEFAHNRRCDAHWIQFYTQCDDSYNQELFHVLGAACGKIPPKRDTILALANSPCRGLEREMTNCFRQRKKQVVANVLQSQAALQKYNQNNVNKNNDKSAEILAQHYTKLAVPALRFARLLAKGDAAIVDRS